MYKVLFAQGFHKQPVLTACIGAFWQGFSSEGATWKLLLCPIEPTPVGSKTDALLAKAGLSASDGTSVVRRRMLPLQGLALVLLMVLPAGLLGSSSAVL